SCTTAAVSYPATISGNGSFAFVYDGGPAAAGAAATIAGDCPFAVVRADDSTATTRPAATNSTAISPAAACTGDCIFAAHNDDSATTRADDCLFAFACIDGIAATCAHASAFVSAYNDGSATTSATAIIPDGCFAASVHAPDAAAAKTTAT